MNRAWFEVAGFAFPRAAGPCPGTGLVVGKRLDAASPLNLHLCDPLQIFWDLYVSPHTFDSQFQGAGAGDWADTGWLLGGVSPPWLLGIEALFLGERYQRFTCLQTSLYHPSNAFWDSQNIFSKIISMFRVKRLNRREPLPMLPCWKTWRTVSAA